MSLKAEKIIQYLGKTNAERKVKDILIYIAKTHSPQGYTIEEIISGCNIDRITAENVLGNLNDKTIDAAWESEPNAGNDGANRKIRYKLSQNFLTEIYKATGE